MNTKFGVALEPGFGALACKWVRCKHICLPLGRKYPMTAGEVKIPVWAGPGILVSAVTTSMR
ncbi:hypothetical protein SRHO_G00201180 [Serrasalmus rhombeus]